MADIINKKKGKFRIYLHDLETKAGRSITLEGDRGETIQDIKDQIQLCFSKEIESSGRMKDKKHIKRC